MSGLVVADLEVRYGSVAAVRGVSFEVAPGEIVGLIGPNGAGKSSTLHAIMGLVPVAAGDVRVAGTSVRGRAPEHVARAGVALVPEGRRIFGELTVDENLRLGLSARRSKDGTDEAVERVLELFPIVREFHARQAGALSGGQQQQLALARALVARPDVLLLDEPSLGLSPTMTNVVFEALVHIREQGIAILLVEQRAQRTVAIADRSHVLANGELRLSLTPADADDTDRLIHISLVTWILATELADFLRTAVEPQVQVDAIGQGAIFALMAVGIGLVFGVLRLVNFAYGQLIMSGAFALAFASEQDWPVWAGIALCFVVVLCLTLAMDRVVFRPLRTQSPATMLVATFAVSFLLQSVALLIDQRDNTLGEPAASLSRLIQPWSIFGTEVRKITVVSIVTAAICLLALMLFLGRTTVGLQMRAASMDFETARLLGVRANLVVGSAVLISGLLAAIVAVLLTVQQPIVTKDFAFFETIVVLAGVVLGGMNRLLSATLGGFAIGYVSGLLGGALPSAQSQYLPSFLFGLVIVVLLVRPQGLFTRGRGLVERV